MAAHVWAPAFHGVSPDGRRLLRGGSSDAGFDVRSSLTDSVPRFIYRLSGERILAADLSVDLVALGTNRGRLLIADRRSGTVQRTVQLATVKRSEASSSTRPPVEFLSQTAPARLSFWPQVATGLQPSRRRQVL